MVSTGLIFPFSYVSMEYFYHIHPPTPFPYILPLPTATNPQDWTCFVFLFSVFVKKAIFLFV
jgi:hypothetical protein